MPGLKENVNCPRRMVVFAVFDIIDKLGGEYEKAMAGDIKAKVNVLGKTSKQLAIHYLMDSVLHYMDEARAFGCKPI